MEVNTVNKNCVVGRKNGSRRLAIIKKLNGMMPGEQIPPNTMFGRRNDGMAWTITTPSGKRVACADTVSDALMYAKPEFTYDTAKGWLVLHDAGRESVPASKRSEYRGIKKVILSRIEKHCAVIKGKKDGDRETSRAVVKELASIVRKLGWEDFEYPDGVLVNNESVIVL